MTRKTPCSKRRYATRAEAQLALERMFARYPSAVYKRVYRCGRCRAWHITSTPRPPSVPGRVKH